MGDIGEYWKEHREYKRRRKYGSVPKHDDQLTKQMKAEKEALRLAQHGISCECGRTFLDVLAHNQHKARWGKKGHKGKAIESRAPELKPAADDWAVF